MNTAEQERAAVIAYMRRCQIAHKRWAAFYGTTKGKHDFHAQACHYFAEAISEGAHLIPYDGEEPET
jgi:hypothetical protein